MQAYREAMAAKQAFELKRRRCDGGEGLCDAASALCAPRQRNEDHAASPTGPSGLLTGSGPLYPKPAVPPMPPGHFVTMADQCTICMTWYPFELKPFRLDWCWSCQRSNVAHHDLCCRRQRGRASAARAGKGCDGWERVWELSHGGPVVSAVGPLSGGRPETSTGEKRVHMYQSHPRTIWSPTHLGEGTVLLIRSPFHPWCIGSRSFLSGRGRPICFVGRRRCNAEGRLEGKCPEASGLPSASCGVPAAPPMGYWSDGTTAGWPPSAFGTGNSCCGQRVTGAFSRVSITSARLAPGAGICEENAGSCGRAAAGICALSHAGCSPRAQGKTGGQSSLPGPSRGALQQRATGLVCARGHLSQRQRCYCGKGCCPARCSDPCQVGKRRRPQCWSGGGCCLQGPAWVEA